MFQIRLLSIVNILGFNKTSHPSKYRSTALYLNTINQSYRNTSLRFRIQLNVIRGCFIFNWRHLIILWLIFIVRKTYRYFRTCPTL